MPMSSEDMGEIKSHVEKRMREFLSKEELSLFNT